MTTTQHETMSYTSESRLGARDLVARLSIGLSPEALALLRAEDSPSAFFARLVGESCWRDARHFLAHALPVRRALWWSCLCAHDVAECEPNLTAAIDAVVRYVRVPSETHRRAAEDIYRREAPESLTSILAAAAYTSAGSVGPRDLASPIAPPSFVTQRLVSTVVYLAATRKNLPQYKIVIRDYVLVGQQIAQGQNLWPDAELTTEFTRIDIGGPQHMLAGPHHRATHGEHHACCAHAYCEEVTG
jgi:hypothetical protein